MAVTLRILYLHQHYSAPAGSTATRAHAMAAGLALAVGAMAYPAFRGNPWSAPGMILILTAGLIALNLDRA